MEDLKISAPEDSLPPVELSALSNTLREACARAGWQRLMPVQAHTMPYLLAGRDMMVQSRTGSGKTGAYLLPMLEKLDPGRKEVQALVLAPTRELANQVEHEAATLFEGTGLAACAVYGGVSFGRQLDALRAGAQVVVGTPGRVLDHLLRRTLSLQNLRILVFDEADRMLSIGFYPDMKQIQHYLPNRRIHATLFSATYPPFVIKLAGEFLSEPEMLSLSQGQVHVAATQHLYCQCRAMDKDRTLVRMLETENPTSAIIFCNTKANVHYIAGLLKGFNYNSDELSADLAQNKREEVLARLRAGEVRLLVATDVAARGIDIPALSHVFLYEPPEDRESYIHRAGRTGRAGAVGTVISLVDIMQKLELERIAKFYKIDLVPMQNPTDESVADVVGQRVAALLEGRKRDCTGLQQERARRFLPLVREWGSGDDEDQLMLLALLLDEQYQVSLGMPLPQPTGSRRAPKTGERTPAADSGGRDERNRKKKRHPLPEYTMEEMAEGIARLPDLSISDDAPAEEPGLTGSEPAAQTAESADGAKKKRRRKRRSGKKVDASAEPDAPFGTEAPLDFQTEDNISQKPAITPKRAPWEAIAPVDDIDNDGAVADSGPLTYSPEPDYRGDWWEEDEVPAPPRTVAVSEEEPPAPKPKRRSRVKKSDKSGEDTSNA